MGDVKKKIPFLLGALIAALRVMIGLFFGRCGGVWASTRR